MAVVIHCKPGCTYCDKAAALLDAMAIAYTKRTYDPSAPDYAKLRDALFDAHGHRSFPNVFVGTTFVGGYTELLKAAENGDLTRFLAANQDDDDF